MVMVYHISMFCLNVGLIYNFTYGFAIVYIF